ncbi:hypothetical protein ACA910_021996 [Epithemia clementina (nom. ined.)]
MCDADQASDQNLLLNQTEYLDSVRRMSYGAVETLSSPLQSVFTGLQNTQGVISLAGANSVNGTGFIVIPLLHNLCNRTFQEILVTLGLTPNYQECRLWMYLGDRSPKDTRLNQQSEYPSYANRMTATNEYTEDVDYDTLPEPVQRVFGDFENSNDTGYIDIHGAWTLPSQTVEEAQLLKLDNLCRQVMVANQAAKVLNSPTTTLSPIQSPTSGGGDSNGGLMIEFSFDECVANLVLADSEDPKDVLLLDEYVDFLNRLTGDAFASQSFDALPSALKRNYVAKAMADNTDGVSIDGARLGSTGSVAALQTFCASTQAALNNESQEPSDDDDDDDDDTTFHLPFSDCTIAMATAEIGNRTDTLDPVEYVLFLNKATEFQYFRNLGFDDLPQPLVDNYNALAALNADGIPIAGSFPGMERSSEQKATLMVICTATSNAINKAIHPSPTASPGSLPPVSAVPTPAPTNTGIVTVFNSFVISNTDGLGVPDILAGNETAGLQEGYRNFVNHVTAELANSERRRVLRQTPLVRFLPAKGVNDGTPNLYQVNDYKCPPSVTAEGSICHVVYGSFNATFVNEPNATAFALSLTNATQTAIQRAQNGLQSFIVAADPQTMIVVEGVPEDGRLQPDQSVDVRGADSGGDSDDGGLSVGLLVGIIIAALVLCCCLGGLIYWCKTSDQNLCASCSCTLPSILKRQDSNKIMNLDSDEKVDPEIGESGGDFSIQVQEQSIRESQRKLSMGENNTYKESMGLFSFGLGRGRRNSNEMPDYATNPNTTSNTNNNEGLGLFSFGLGKGRRNSLEMESSSPNTTTTKDNEGMGLFSFGLGKSRRNSLENNNFPGHDLNNSREAGLDINNNDDENSVAAETSQPSLKSPKSEKSEKPWSTESRVPGQSIWDIVEAEGGDDDDDEESSEEEDDDDDESSEEEGEGDGGDEEIVVEEIVEIIEESDDDDDDDDEDSEADEIVELFEDEDDGHGDDDDDESKADQTYVTAALPGNIKKFNNMVETGDWEGVVEAAKKFDHHQDDADSYVGGKITAGLGPGDSSDDESDVADSADEDDDDDEAEREEVEEKDAGGDGKDGDDNDGGGEDDDDGDGDDDDDGEQSRRTEGESTQQSSNTNGMSYTSEELRTREEYQKKVEELVRLVAPDETENVATMMDQFAGREEELINTLETMYERSYSVRARNAIHKSKSGIPNASLSKLPPRARAPATSSAAVAAASSILGRPPDSSTSRSSDRDLIILDNVPKKDLDELLGSSTTKDEDVGTFGEDTVEDDESSDEDDDDDDDDNNNNESAGEASAGEDSGAEIETFDKASGGGGDSATADNSAVGKEIQIDGDEDEDEEVAEEESESYDDDIVDDDDIEYEDDYEEDEYEEEEEEVVEDEDEEIEEEEEEEVTDQGGEEEEGDEGDDDQHKKSLHSAGVSAASESDYDSYGDDDDEDDDEDEEIEHFEDEDE